MEPAGWSAQRRRPALLPGTGWTAHLVTFAAGAMAFLAVLSLAATLTAQTVAEQWRTDLAGVATVRISATAGDVEARVAAVIEVLRTTPGIAEIRRLSEDEQNALIAPWLGGGTDLSALPMPQLIDVMLVAGGPDQTALQERLDLTVSGAVYDNHAVWRGPLARAADALEGLSLGAAVLVLLTVAALVAFAARTTLLANHSVVVTLRLMGAEDGFIARAFVGRLVLRAAMGTALGTALGALAILLLPGVETDDPSLSLGASPTGTGWLIMCVAVPMLFVTVTWTAAMVAVAMTLKRLP